MTFGSKFVFLTPNCLQYRPIFIFPGKRLKTSSEKEEQHSNRSAELHLVYDTCEYHKMVAKDYEILDQKRNWGGKRREGEWRKQEGRKREGGKGEGRRGEGREAEKLSPFIPFPLLPSPPFPPFPPLISPTLPSQLLSSPLALDDLETWVDRWDSVHSYLKLCKLSSLKPIHMVPGDAIVM